MEVALRRRLEGVTAIDISQERQTAEVRFRPAASRFSPAAFREAVKEADVEVSSFVIDVCGIVVQDGTRAFVHAGTDRYLLASAQPATPDLVCFTAQLDDSTTPGTIGVAPAAR